MNKLGIAQKIAPPADLAMECNFMLKSLQLYSNHLLPETYEKGDYFLTTRTQSRASKYTSHLDRTELSGLCIIDIN